MVHQTFLNALKIAVTLPIWIFLPMVVSFLVYQRTPGWQFFRVVFFLPYTISPVIVGLIWRQILHVQGPVNGLLRRPQRGGSCAQLAGRQEHRAVDDRRGGAVEHLRVRHRHLPRGHGHDRRGDLRRGGNRRGQLLDEAAAHRHTHAEARDGLLGHHLHRGHARLDVPVHPLDDHGRAGVLLHAARLPGLHGCVHLHGARLRDGHRPGALPLRRHHLGLPGPLHVPVRLGEGSHREQGGARGRKG